jgi:hypothetical protein
MAAHWRQLTEFLAQAADQVRLTWPELDTIVGGMPASAVTHHPQWWHGDRSHTRAWRAAGFEAREIEPGVSVLFARTGSAPTDVGRRSRSCPAVTAPTVESPEALRVLNPTRCLIVIPCSASKRRGGFPGLPTTASGDLAAARRDVLKRPDTRTDESLVMPAWQRYDGHLYRAAGSALGDLAAKSRLVILSGGYGVLDGSDLIGDYNRLMNPSDWPRGVLERALSDRAAQSGLDVVAFAGMTTAYAKVLRRTRWQLPSGGTGTLVALDGIRGVTGVSVALGRALRAFVEGRSTYPPGVIVKRLAP